MKKEKPKIMDPEVREYLKKSGVTDKEISKIIIREIKPLIIERLEAMAGYIRSGDWERANKMLGYSPAGDDMGCDNKFIDFSDLLGDNHGCGADISDAINYLEQHSK